MLLLKPEGVFASRLQVSSCHHALTWVNVTRVNQLRQQYRVLLESIT